YRPLGARRQERADVRLIAATNHCLDALVQNGRFRLDLLHRLKLMHLQLPPLRDRGSDIHFLAHHFLELGAARFGRSSRPFAQETLDWFDRYPWPGNIRELEHIVYQGLLLSDGDSIAIPAPPIAGTTSRSGTKYHQAK